MLSIISPFHDPTMLTCFVFSTDQMTIMIESSRLFLWTEYARSGCKCVNLNGVDPKVWDILPDRFSDNAEARMLLKRVKEDKKIREEREKVFYDDAALQALIRSENGVNERTNGH